MNNLHDFFGALQALPLAALIRGETEGGEWLFPIIETLHVCGLTMFFGSIALIDLRMLGVFAKQRRFADYYAEILPLALAAFVWSVVFGGLLFLSKAQTYAENFYFQMKMLCVVLAAINIAVFHLGVYRRMADWEAQPEPPTAVRVAGGLSLIFWISVICFGRWTGWTA
jgi:hypothetical protein